MADGASATILIVDDSEDNRYAVRRHLEQAAFRVVEAASGEDTLRVAEQNPDLIILDVDLPDLNGFDVCRRLKSQPATAVIPVLHLSATYTLSQHRAKGLDGGADGYLCHPVEPVELIATVNALLRVRRAEQALRDADRRKDEFLAMLAHELRNPLAPIRTAVEVLRLLNAEDETIQSASQIVDRQVSHMSRLIDELLDVSRIARGKIVLQPARCDLVALVRETVSDHRGTFNAQGMSVETELSDRPLWIHGDRTRLVQVVGNILHNARKFTDAGGTVRVAVAAEEGEAVVVIEDTGIGMDEATLGNLFEPFSQADRSLDRSRGGLGLGLALVKGLTELHGGRVEAASEGVGRGSRFTIRLPLLKQEVASVGAGPLSAAPARRLRVLAIEDHADTAAGLKMLLDILGHEVRIAPTGSTGVAAGREFLPELILCDLGLPGALDGFGVASILRNQPETAGVFLVAVTGYGQPEDREACLAAGFDRHVTKPIDVAALGEILAHAARRASDREHGLR